MEFFRSFNPWAHEVRKSGLLPCRAVYSASDIETRERVMIDSDTEWIHCIQLDSVLLVSGEFYEEIKNKFH